MKPVVVRLRAIKMPVMWGAKIFRRTYGALLVSSLVLFAYRPAWGMGFFAEDYILIDLLVRLSPKEYLFSFFDPPVPAGWYRPFQGIQMAIEYLFFGVAPTPYHIVQTLLHLGSCLLIYGMASHGIKNWLAGLIAASFYAVLPTHSAAVMWVSVTDPLLTFFYLLSISVWWAYLRTPKRLFYLLSLTCFLITLLSKEIGATLIIAMRFMDLLLTKTSGTRRSFFRRYAPFFLILLPYAWFFMQRTSAYVSDNYSGPYAGLGMGPHLISNLWYYLGILVIPWLNQSLWNNIGAMVGLVFWGWLTVIKHHRWIFFLGVMAVVTIIPVLPLPAAGPRYLYLPFVASSIFFALILVLVWSYPNAQRWIRVLVIALVGLGTWGGVSSLAEGAEAMTGLARQMRTPFRPVFQKRPAFETDSYVYFLNSPVQASILSGMFASRYGANPSVASIESARTAGLKDHQSTFIYYFDDQGHIIEQAAEPLTSSLSTPSLPVNWNYIQLEGFELAKSRLKHSETIIVILYWRTLETTKRNYTVFTHLADNEGKYVTGYDSEPQGNRSHTSTWSPGKLVVDWIVIPVTEDLSPGDYQLELGWYNPDTSERLIIPSPTGDLDKMIIKPITIE